jgi:hypothetical protein
MLGRIVAFLAMWAMLVAVMAMELYPALTNGARQWPLLVVMGPPIYVTAELVAAKVFSHESGVRISSATFSWKRVLVAFLVCLGVAWMIAVAVLM